MSGRPLLAVALAGAVATAPGASAQPQAGLEKRAVVAFSTTAPDGEHLTFLLEAYQSLADGSARLAVRVVPGTKVVYGGGRAYTAALPAGAFSVSDTEASLTTRLGGARLHVEWSAKPVGPFTPLDVGVAIYTGPSRPAPAFVELGATSCSVGSARFSTSVMSDPGDQPRPLSAVPRLTPRRCREAAEPSSS